MDRPDAEASVWALIENSRNIIVLLEDDGTISFVYQAVEATFGYEPDGLVGSNAFDLIHDDDRAEIQDRFTSLITHPDQATDRVQHRLYPSTGEFDHRQQRTGSCPTGVGE